ncbi:hypothetical protein [Nonomuraea zeae]|uniref:Uncharacterized protein n=1 Tax=Nonomuraea zeae TaxID=1642303 RepID=A0A5S4GSD2_9ACTN|nr:hypothetical protein [Nonomuraea zeae]TMR35868.1 hypothetical protein ETD85_12360 [Nonomuraea zeae]
MMGCLARTPGAGGSRQALHDGIALFTHYMSAERRARLPIDTFETFFGGRSIAVRIRSAR